MAREKDFTEDTKTKCLLWSDRHCCVCGKSCGLDIEVHHIDPKGGNDLDNAIPVCYDCHAKLGRYMAQHPKGTKYRIKEIKQRREQIYERYTMDLIPSLTTGLHAQYGGSTYQFPAVGFSIASTGRFTPVRAKLVVKSFLGRKELPQVDLSEKPYYSGGLVWHINPGLLYRGWFTLSQECVNSKEEVKVELNMTVIDPYEREHKLLPTCFTYLRDSNCWYLEPASFSELKKHMKK